jgi:chloramphenicol 3-O phosphotransferase
LGDSAVIVLLNGASSAGKTTIATGLLEALSGPVIHLPLDAFYELLPTRYQTPIWPLFTELAQGLHRMALAWESLGFTPIVDTVLEREALFFDCVKQLGGRQTYFVGVHCPLAELRRRARGRSDRDPKWTEYQVGRVHAHGPYDLELDTDARSPAECVAALVDHICHNPQPSALQRARERLGL